MPVKNLAITVLMLVSTSVTAQIQKSGVSASQSRSEFCAKSSNPDYFRSLLYNQKNLLPFDNVGGAMGMGVCWWHSMLTRNAQYLTVYRPELPKPLETDALRCP